MNETVGRRRTCNKVARFGVILSIARLLVRLSDAPSDNRSAPRRQAVNLIDVATCWRPALFSSAAVGRPKWYGPPLHIVRPDTFDFWKRHDAIGPLVQPIVIDARHAFGGTAVARSALERQPHADRMPSVGRGMCERTPRCAVAAALRPAGAGDSSVRVAAHAERVHGWVDGWIGVDEIDLIVMYAEGNARNSGHYSELGKRNCIRLM